MYQNEGKEVLDAENFSYDKRGDTGYFATERKYTRRGYFPSYDRVSGKIQSLHG